MLIRYISPRLYNNFCQWTQIWKTLDHVGKPNWTQINLKYKRFKDKIPGMWPKPWKRLWKWFPLLLGMDAKCVCLRFLFVSFYECCKFDAIINPTRIFLVEELFAISLMCNWCYSDPDATNNILSSWIIDLFPLFGDATLICNRWYKLVK